MAGEPEEIIVDEGSDGLRLDLYLAKVMQGASRAAVQEWIRDGHVLLNGRSSKASTKVSGGDQIDVDEPSPSLLDLEPHVMPLDIIHEDNDLIVVNKPAGISVHPGAGDRVPTLVEGVLAHVGTLAGGDDHVRPGVVHRLDKDTTGALVFAKNRATHAHLAQQFHDKTNERTYIALMYGRFSDPLITVSSFLRRDPKARTKFTWCEGSKEDNPPTGSKWSISHFEAREIFADSLVLATVQLETGRTHQIRVHALQNNTPIVGDSVYYKNADLSRIPVKMRNLLQKASRQMLHAWRLGFVHPSTGEEKRFEASLPSDFSQLIEELRGFSKPADD